MELEVKVNHQLERSVRHFSQQSSSGSAAEHRKSLEANLGPFLETHSLGDFAVGKLTPLLLLYLMLFDRGIFTTS